MRTINNRYEVLEHLVIYAQTVMPSHICEVAKQTVHEKNEQDFSNYNELQDTSAFHHITSHLYHVASITNTALTG
jgi:hypothetical protein